MKKHTLLLAAIAATISAQAQNKDQGRIEYEFTINVHANLKPDQQQFKDMVPEKMVQQMELTFSGDRATMKTRQQDAAEQEQDGVKTKVVFSSGESDAPQITFFDTAAEKKYDLLSKDGKEKLKSYPFKIIPVTKQGTRTKKILGYNCREVFVDDAKSKKPITLWVTSELPFSWGPMGMSVSGGAVLAMESKGFSAMATSVKFLPVNRADVSIPAGVPVEEGKLMKLEDVMDNH